MGPVPIREEIRGKSKKRFVASSAVTVYGEPSVWSLGPGTQLTPGVFSMRGTQDKAKGRRGGMHGDGRLALSEPRLRWLSAMAQRKTQVSSRGFLRPRAEARLRRTPLSAVRSTSTLPISKRDLPRDWRCRSPRGWPIPRGFRFYFIF